MVFTLAWRINPVEASVVPRFLFDNPLGVAMFWVLYVTCMPMWIAALIVVTALFGEGSSSSLPNWLPQWLDRFGLLALVLQAVTYALLGKLVSLWLRRRSRSKTGRTLVAGFLLLPSVSWCSAVSDANIVALGDWSKPVANEDGAAIRGRLLVCEYPNHRGGTGLDLGVYIELQEYSDFVGGPIEVYCDIAGGASRVAGRGSGLRCELRDGAGRAVPASMASSAGGAPVSCWVSLQPYSSVRLRASVFGGGRLQDGSLGIGLPGAGGWWTLSAKDTNSYFLSGTFTATPPANHIPADSRYLWRGTLQLPALTISNKRPIPSPNSSQSRVLKREPEYLTLTLAWVADAGEPEQYEFVVNGIVAYKTLEGLKKSLKDLPKGSVLSWVPDCDRWEGKPLSSAEELRKIEEFCNAIGITFVLVPSG